MGEAGSPQPVSSSKSTLADITQFNQSHSLSKLIDFMMWQGENMKSSCVLQNLT